MTRTVRPSGNRREDHKETAILNPNPAKLPYHRTDSEVPNQRFVNHRPGTSEPGGGRAVLKAATERLDMVYCTMLVYST
eukprot:439569-Hanusia_phi.AAC.4